MTHEGGASFPASPPGPVDSASRTEAHPEWFDVVDEQDAVIGRAPRAEVHARGLRHRATHVWVEDGTGRLLLQRRAATKDREPDLWTSSVSGHLDAGEDYATAARREVGEELGWGGGVRLEEVGRAPAGPETDQEFVRVYRTLLPGPFRPPGNEVAEVRWVSREELAAWLRAEPQAFSRSFRHLWQVLRPGPRFVESLWDAGRPVFAAILRHPFLAGLTDGSLPVECFRHYVVQDSHYLRDYGRALAHLGARCADDGAFQTLARHGAGAIDVERALHAGFLAAWDLDERAVAAHEVAPTCLAYTGFILRHVHGSPLEEAIAAVLPCYWIYREVGAALLARGSPDPLYARWIATYGGEIFGDLVREALEIADAAGTAAPPERRAAMGRRFHTGCRYEWMFWDMAWRRESWPV